MPGTAVTRSVVATEPGGKKREEIFVDIIERISVTFSSSVSTGLCHALSSLIVFSSTSQDILPFFSFSFHEILYVCPEFVVLTVLDSDDAHCKIIFHISSSNFGLFLGFCLYCQKLPSLPFVPYITTVKIASVFTVFNWNK